MLKKWTRYILAYHIRNYFKNHQETILTNSVSQRSFKVILRSIIHTVYLINLCLGIRVRKKLIRCVKYSHVYTEAFYML